MKTGAASPTVTEALWYDLRDLELKLTWGTENWPYGRTLKNKLGSYMFKINITCNVPSDLSEVLCLAWLLLFLIWHVWPKSKKIALPRWNLWPLCASGSLCCIFRPAGVHVEEATPWIPVPDSCTRWACSVLEFAFGEDLNYLLFDFLALAAWYKKYLLLFPNSASMSQANYFLPKSIFKKKKLRIFSKPVRIHGLACH